jgi:hypothetical protein
MEGYLGEVDVTNDPVRNPHFGITPQDWAIIFIGCYGGIDGSHHKDWVLDQVSRILNGTPVIVHLASWDNGQTEIRFWTGEPTIQYNDWVVELKSGEDGPETYSYDEGITP